MAKVLEYKFSCEPAAGGGEFYWYKVAAKSKQVAEKLAKENNPHCKILFYGSFDPDWYTEDERERAAGVKNMARDLAYIKNLMRRAELENDAALVEELQQELNEVLYRGEPDRDPNAPRYCLQCGEELAPIFEEQKSVKICRDCEGGAL